MHKELTIGRALGLGFQAWFRNFVPVTLLALVLYAPVFLWIAAVDLESADSLERVLDLAFVWPVLAVIGLSTLLSPMLTYRVIQDLNGVRVSMWTSIRHGLRGFVPAIMIAIAVNVLNVLPGGFFSIIAVMLTCIYFVAAPAAVVEKLGAMEALARSSVLTFQRRWRIFGVLLPIGIAVFAMMFGWFLPRLNDPTADLLGNLRSTSMLFIGVLALLNLFTSIVQAVAYALLREEKDGVSHEQLAQVFE